MAHHYLLFPAGSHGDVHPFAGLARELVRRGERTTVLTSGYFAYLFERTGADFVDLLDAREFLELVDDDAFWQPGIGPLRAIMALTALGHEPQLAAVEKRRHESPRLVCGALAFGARSAGEAFDLPAATVQLAPASFLSVHAPPKIAGLWLPAWMPLWLRRAWYALGDEVSDRLLMGELAAFRRRLGLPRVRGFARHWFNSPQLTLAMFPEWFAARAPDWPDAVRQTGFPLWDEATTFDPPAQAQAFLDACADRPPIAFTPGSAMLHGEAFFSAAIDACQRLERPGVLLTRHRRHLPAELPATVRHFDFLPFSWLLPRCAALVHHGGIGTASQALAAGIPQLIAAIAFDQPDNASRIEALGLGVASDFRAFCKGGEVARLGRLLDDQDIADRCTATAARMVPGEGIASACDWLTRERWPGCAPPDPAR